MDTPTLRILDATSSSIGSSLSINQLTQRIKTTHGTAYYANIYQKLQELKNEGLLTLDPIGRSSNVKLNFQNYLLIDALAEMEIEKKRKLLTKLTNLLPFLTEMDHAFKDTYTIKTITAINPAKSLKLNRIELLFLIAETQDSHTETVELFKEMQKLQNKHNLKIDSLILNKTDFQELSTSDEISPVREALSEKIIFFGPQAFWSQIRDITEKTEIKASKTETKPASIPEIDIAYNFNRFGYRELGRPINQGQKICIEYITTALLLQDDVRLQEAAPVILAKNSFKSNVLAFLSQKFGTSNKLLGTLKILQELKPTREIDQTIDLLSIFSVEEISADKESIMAKLRLYNAL
ncbi:MAG: hypothetical protein NWF00_09825 [Candidatus Bathyarchaeota archaeon]|nr:hypothetical protein [Candidatus Bathyarchaeota archaeon]